MIRSGGYLGSLREGRDDVCYRLLDDFDFGRRLNKW